MQAIAAMAYGTVTVPKVDKIVGLGNVYVTAAKMACGTAIDFPAGSIFIGFHAPVSVGDYASGTNHVLPTAGYARMFSGYGKDNLLCNIT